MGLVNELVSLNDSSDYIASCFYKNKNNKELLKCLTLLSYIKILVFGIVMRGKCIFKKITIQPVTESKFLVF